MLVVQAQHLGMCFGVRDALEMMRQVPEPSEVTVHGELVHNPVVTDELTSRGFKQQTERFRHSSPTTKQVLITAHGISNRRRQRFQDDGFQLIDTTCPLVRRAHKVALHYQKSGYFLIVVGRPGHVEVEGLIGDLHDFTVVSSLDDVCNVKRERIAVINQTTTRPDKVAAFHERIALLNKGAEIKFLDTTCQPTRDRQNSIVELVKKVQALVVVGGPNSNNTLQLGLRAQEYGIPWWRVSEASEIERNWFENIRIVGLTAGTSTTDDTIQKVARVLRRIKPHRLTA